MFSQFDTVGSGRVGSSDRQSFALTTGGRPTARVASVVTWTTPWPVTRYVVVTGAPPLPSVWADSTRRAGVPARKASPRQSYREGGGTKVVGHPTARSKV